MVGEDRWPLPIPLVRQDQRWEFDGGAGAQELLLRRIGANELRTIDVMHGYVEAQKHYAALARRRPRRHLRDATTQRSWKAERPLLGDRRGSQQSPAGPLLAEATSAGYVDTPGKATPYHGYLLRLLLSQGPDATGGPRSYLTTVSSRVASPLSPIRPTTEPAGS